MTGFFDGHRGDTAGMHDDKIGPKAFRLRRASARQVGGAGRLILYLAQAEAFEQTRDLPRVVLIDFAPEHIEIIGVERFHIRSG